MTDWTRRLTVARPLAALAAIIAIVSGLGFAGSPVVARQTSLMLVHMAIVVGLYIFVGNSGVLSFGHISFVAIGAYATAIMTVSAVQKDVLLPRLPDYLRHLEVPAPLALVVAGALAAVIAVVMAFPLMRLSGIAASIAMFALLLIVNNVAVNWTAVTRGDATMIGVPRVVDDWVLAGIVVAIVAVAFAYQLSPWGMRLRASRDDELAAVGIGVRVVRERRVAMLLSAFVVGVGGYLYAQFQGAFSPDAFYVSFTFLTIAMLVVGGLNTLSGAVIGTIALSALSEMLRRVEEGVRVVGVEIPSRPGLQQLGLAVVLLLTLVLLPRGLTRGREIFATGRARQGDVT